MLRKFLNHCVAFVASKSFRLQVGQLVIQEVVCR